MRSDGVWRRIRWGNVARLGALVALAVLVAAWPRLGGDPPRLPPAEPVPVAGSPGGWKRPRGGATGGEGERAPAERRGGDGEGAPTKRPPPVSAAKRPPPVSAAKRPPPDPAAAEFGLP
jgi:hypothetical protein